MATRRTTMKSGSGTKLYAVRDSSGQFKDIQTYKRAHAADLRHKSKAETAATQGPMEKKVRKAAKNAVETVERSVKGAVAAMERAAKRAVKQVSNPQPAMKMTVTRAAGKGAAKPGTKGAGKRATKKATGKPAARKMATKVTRKPAAKKR